MPSLFQIIIISIFTLVPWGIILYLLSVFKNLPRTYFVLLHYLVNILLFGIVFYIFYARFSHPSPFATMAVSMAVIFVTEFIVWNFLYSGDLWFLNFFDWMLPAFLIASTVYFVGEFFG